MYANETEAATDDDVCYGDDDDGDHDPSHHLYFAIYLFL